MLDMNYHTKADAQEVLHVNSHVNEPGAVVLL